MDAGKPGIENWIDIVAETEVPVQSVSTAGHKLFVEYLKDAKSQIKQFDNTG